MSASESRHLVLAVRVEAGRYHGEPEWPPSPARVFQALVAASARCERLEEMDAEALAWLEALPPPLMAAPGALRGQEVKLWVPNNDLDAKDGNPEAVSSIRAGKKVHPRIFDARAPLLYAWPLVAPEDEAPAVRVCEIALGLYQLGRGVDMASATGTIANDAGLRSLLARHGYAVYRPTPGASTRGRSYNCPMRGSLASLRLRHAASLGRFQAAERGGRSVFQQPPKPRFTPIAYDSAPPRALFEIRPLGDMGALCATPLVHAVQVAEAIRDAAAARLAAALPRAGQEIERALIGRSEEGVKPLLTSRRVRLIPLPSIGHEHVDRGIRRVLVEKPYGCALRADDVFWAFSGLEVRMPTRAEAVLVRTDESSMLRHYGVHPEPRARRFRTVTPAALPAARRRISPAPADADTKPASEREEEEARARGAVAQALRHAGVEARLAHVRVQREPFHDRGQRAEGFSANTRFAKERLWHVDIRFREPVAGPLVIGDGRFLGLGLMEAVEEPARVLAYRVIEGLSPDAQPECVSEALRRATMARFQERSARREPLPSFLSGHTPDGRPARDRARLAYVFDSSSVRLLLIAVHAHGGYLGKREGRHLTTLALAMDGFEVLRAGAAGLLRLAPVDVNADEDPLFAPSRRWQTRTPYTANRHHRASNAEGALVQDVELSLRAARVPRARVQVEQVWLEPGVGLRGHVVIDFAVAVAGPILLGRDRYKGGGLFGGVAS